VVSSEVDACQVGADVTPSELNRRIADINERLHSTLTALSALLLLAVVDLAGAYALHALPAGAAKTVATLSLAGVLIALVVSRGLTCYRNEAYEDVIVAGFRHVHPQAVSQRAASLIAFDRRRRLADSLDRLVEVGFGKLSAPIPVHREGLQRCAPQVRAIAELLRTPGVELRAAGIVLLRRLMCEGATSPLFKPESPPRELERALERIFHELGHRQPPPELRLAA
jgi:hypothetical protein